MSGSFFLRSLSVVICFAWISIYTLGISAAEEPTPLELMYQMKASYASVKDYTAIFIRQERQDHKLQKEEKIFLNFKLPFAIRMKWLTGKEAGREAIYVEGENQNRLLVKMTGLLSKFVGMMTLDPEGKLARRGGKRSIRQAGIGNLIDSLLKVTQEAEKKGDLTLHLLGEEVLAGRKVYMIERLLPPDREYDSPKTIIYIDKELGLPIQIERYDKNGELFERYFYQDLMVNQDLSDTGFRFKDKFKRDTQADRIMEKNAREIIRRAAESYEVIRDYSGRFEKEERIDGKLSEREVYELKFLKPFYLYLKLLQGKWKETEIFYSPSLNDEKMVVKPGGLIGKLLSSVRVTGVPIGIDAKFIQKENRHLINEFGIGSFLERYQKDFDRGTKKKQLYIDTHPWNLDGDEGDRIELILNDEKDLPDFYAYRTLVFFSKQTGLPTEIKVFNDENDVLEYYRYCELRTNTGLTAGEFDPMVRPTPSLVSSVEPEFKPAADKPKVNAQ